MLFRNFAALAAALGLVFVGLLAPKTCVGKDVVDTAVAAGSFNTLAAALKAAGLVEALKGNGPFTVFAPTDDAFAKLPAGTVEMLLKPENKQQLIGVLTYHVVPGSVTAAQVMTLNAAETLNQQRVDVKVSDGKVTIDGANVVKADIECDNGVIHVIDSVLLPSGEDVPNTAAKAGKFKTLVAALEAAGLVEALAGEGPFTVFAPTDEAFGKLPAGTVESLLLPENREKLVAILKYHVVPGRVFSDAALKAGQAKTLQGGTVKIAANGGVATVDKATLIGLDIDASNGVIHVIDQVILPSDNASAANPRQMIEQAVAQGSRLFNEGHASACARTYSHAMREILTLENHGMSSDAVDTVRTALHRAENTHCSASQAWILRDGLNAAYRSMSSTLADTTAAQ